MKNIMFRCRLRSLRKENHLSQQELAEILGVGSNTVSTWERGTRYPTLEMIKKLSAFFNVSLAFLEGETDDHGSPEYSHDLSADQENSESWNELFQRIQYLSAEKQQFLWENIRFVLGLENLL